MIGDWFRIQTDMYFRNASAQRDYRSQMRGMKAPLYWTLYLGLLILAFTLFYAGTWQNGSVSISQMQTSLRGYYMVLVGMLEFAVGLAAPVLAASSVVVEYQRRSMELLMTAPVTPRYFLVGKLVSSYRYVWMLLALSIPLTAACVVLGGATWVQVLETYFIISLHGVVYAALGLLIGVLSQKPIPAVTYSLVTVFFYSLFMGYMNGPGIMSAIGGLDTSPLMGLAPGGAIAAAGSRTMIFGAGVPIWVVTLAASIYIVGLLLLGAGSGLSGYGAPLTRKLRIVGLITMLLMGAAAGTSNAGMAGVAGSMSRGWLGTMYWVVSVALLPVIAYMGTWSIYGERKYAPDRPFRFKKILIGGSGSALPYTLAMFLVFTLGMLTAAVLASSGNTSILVDPQMWAGLAWLLGLWMLFVTVARLASSLNKGELRMARGWFVALICGFVLLPIPVLLFMRNVFEDPSGFDNTTMLLYPFAAVFSSQSHITAGAGLILFIFAVLLLTISEGKRVKRMNAAGATSP